MPSLLSLLASRIAEKFRGPGDATARRRRNLYKDKFWTAIELLEDRTLLSGTAPNLVPVPPAVQTPAPVNVVSGGDFNNDGHQDVVSGTNSTPAYQDPTLYVSLTDGQGQVTQTIALSGFFGSVIDVQVGDLTGDGVDDIVTASHFYNDSAERHDIVFGVWANNGAGSFTLTDSWSLQDRSEARLQLADFSGDGLADVAYATSGDDGQGGAVGELEVFVTNGGETSFHTVSSQLSGRVADLEVADFDLNGTQDVLLATNLTGYDAEAGVPTNFGAVQFFAHQGGFDWSAPETIAATTDIITGIEATQVTDYPGSEDAQSDLVMTTEFVNPATHGGETVVLIDRVNESFASMMTLTDGAPSQVTRQLTVADLDNDGKADIVSLVENDNGRKIVWYRNEGEGNFAASAQVLDASAGTNSFHLAFAPRGENGAPLEFLAAAASVPGQSSETGETVVYAVLPTLSISGDHEIEVDRGGAAPIASTDLNTTSSDSNVTADQIVYTLVAAPQHGDLILESSGYLYALAPDTEFSTFTQDDLDAGRVVFLSTGDGTDPDGFTFTVSDGDLTSPETTFAITVTEPAAQPTIPIQLISRANPSEPDSVTGSGLFDATSQSISGDGRFVVFTGSRASDGVYEIYLYDRQSGTRTLISAGLSGADADGSSLGAVITPDGRFIAFSSDASNLVAGDTNGYPDAFVYDTTDGTLERIAANSNLPGSPRGAYGVSISGDGNLVAYESSVLPNFYSHVYLYNRTTQTTTQISASLSGTFSDSADSPRVSANGEWVAFSGSVFDFDAQSGLIVGTSNAYLYEVATGQVTQLTYGTNGGFPQQSDRDDSRVTAISGDGRYLVIRSHNNTLVAGDTNLNEEIYVYDRLADPGSQFERVSVGPEGAATNGTSEGGSISDDGRYVVFYSDASNLAPADGNFTTDVFVYDRQNGTTIRVTRTSANLDNPGQEGSYYASISGDGQWVAFVSNSAHLSQTPDTNDNTDIFLASLNPQDGGNTAPQVTNAGATVDEGGLVVIEAAALEATDAEQSPFELVYTITSAPQHGSLALDNVAIGVGDTFTQEDIDGGQLTYSHGGDEVSTSDAFSFTISDGQGGEIGETTFAITVVPTNDAPTAQNGTLYRIQDAPGAVDLGFIDPTILLSDAETTDLGHFTYEVLGVTHGTFVVDTEISGNGQYIVFTPESGYVGPAVISVRATDTGDRGAPPRSVDYTITIDFTAPIARDDSTSVNEDGTVNIDVLANDTVYGQGESNAVQVTDPSPYGTAVVNPDRTITFTPSANFNGQTSFEYTLVNAGGMTRVATVTVNVASINDAPAGTDKTVETDEDFPYTFTTADFGFSDENDLPQNTLLSVVIESLPATDRGTLTLDGLDVAEWQEISATEIAAGKLVFTPAADVHGEASFTFKVRDNGGTANGGVDLDQSANTMTIDVVSINDAPEGADNTTITTDEDTPYTFATADFGFTDPDDDPANGFFAVTIDTLPAAGTLKLAGSDVEAGDSISAVDIASGLLVFHPAGNAPAGAATGTPYASFTFRVQDDGGTANGGVDTDPSANTITINVTPDADTPTLEVADPDVVNEDQDGAGVTISLSVTSVLTDTDGSETHSVVVSGVPVGVTLTDGSNTFTGSVGNAGTTPNIVGWNLGSLVAVVPEHFAFDFTLSVTARATERANGDFATTSDTIFVAITAVADAPTLTTSDVTRNEDQTIPLTVSTALVDADGSESLTVFVKGLPAGVVISDGAVAHTVESTGEDQWIDITGWTLSGLRLTPVLHSDQNFTLTFKSKATESENGEFATTERTLDVTVVAVADAPNLTVSAGTGNEDTPIDIPVSTSLVDVDLSETLTITVEGAPAGSVFTDGSNEAPVDVDGQTIDITGWNHANLKVTPPEHSGDNFTLTFRSTATEARDDSTAQTVRTALVTVKDVADAPNLTASSPGGNEDTPISLNIASSLVDADGSETLRIVLGGIPLGAIVQDGFGQNDHRTQLGDTSVDVTTWNLASLTITPPLNFRGTINLTATATATEDEIWPGQSVATTVVPFDVVVLPVNDTPHVDPTVQPTIFQDGFHFDALNRPVDLGYIEFDLRAYLTDVETDPDDFTFEIQFDQSGNSAFGGTAVVNPDGNIARFTPDPDFVGIASFTYRATDTGDLPGADPFSAPITRTGTITIQVLRYQDLGDAPDSYGTTTPNQGPRDQGGARHGGQHDEDDPIRLGRIVGYGEPNGHPSDDANLDDLNNAFEDRYGGPDLENGSVDDEDGVSVLTGIEARDDRDLIRTLRIEAPAGGMLDAWIDFNRDGDFDEETERLVYRNNRIVVSDGEGGSGAVSVFELGGSDGRSLVLSAGVNYVDVVIPADSVAFGSTNEDGEPIQLSQVTTQGRFRISSAGGLNAVGFAPDGEVEDYVVEIGNRNPPPGVSDFGVFEDALETATSRFIDAYGGDLIANPDFVPKLPGEAGYVPMLFSGVGDGGDAFEEGELPEELREILAAINTDLAPGRGLIDNMFVFVSDPVDFVITDPSGRTAGHTAAGGTFNNIGGNVSYSGNGAIELLVIRNASAGEYKIEFTGVGGVFRGGSSFLTAAGVQQSAFQGALARSADVALSLEFTAPTIGSVDDKLADAGGRGQAFFNVLDDGAAGDDEDALSALSALDAENDSGSLSPREQILKWIDAVRGSAKSARRAALDEFEPDWLVDDSEEYRNLLDEFWTGLGSSMLGNIPGQVFQLGEFLGVDVPLLFAPETPDDAQPAKQPSAESSSATTPAETSQSSVERDGAASTVAVADADDAGPEGAGQARTEALSGWLTALAGRRAAPFGARSSKFNRP